MNLLKCIKKLGMVLQVFNPSTWERQEDLYTSSLVYIMSSQDRRGYTERPYLKLKTKQTKKSQS